MAHALLSNEERIERETAFEEETFEGLDLAGAKLSGKEFRRCAFRGAKLNQTAWNGTVLEDCIFDRCDLSNMVPKGASLRGVEFRDSKLIGVTWADLRSEPMFTFVECNMRYQSFAKLDARLTKLAGCAIEEASFLEVNLTKAVFKNCSLAKTTIEKCVLTGADFSSSTGVFFDPSRNKSRGARISAETAVLIASAMGLVVAR